MVSAGGVGRAKAEIVPALATLAVVVAGVVGLALILIM